jgi:hypothetical protein
LKRISVVFWSLKRIPRSSSAPAAWQRSQIVLVSNLATDIARAQCTSDAVLVNRAGTRYVARQRIDRGCGTCGAGDQVNHCGACLLRSPIHSAFPRYYQTTQGLSGSHYQQASFQNKLSGSVALLASFSVKKKEVDVALFTKIKHRRRMQKIDNYFASDFSAPPRVCFPFF